MAYEEMKKKKKVASDKNIVSVEIGVRE